jgi:hypothetical protein
LSIPYDKVYSRSHCTHQSHISGPLQTPPPPPAMWHKLHHDGRSSIPISASHHRFTLFYILSQSILPLSALLRRDRHSFIPFGLIRAPLFHSMLDTPISALFSLRRVLLNCHQHSYIGFRTPYPPSTNPHTFWRSSAERALLKPHQCSSTRIGASLYHSALQTPPLFRYYSTSLDAAQSPIPLHRIDLALFFFILDSCNTALPIWHSSCSW